jgi:hypothetical protein
MELVLYFSPLLKVQTVCLYIRSICVRLVAGADESWARHVVGNWTGSVQEVAGFGYDITLVDCQLNTYGWGKTPMCWIIHHIVKKEKWTKVLLNGFIMSPLGRVMAQAVAGFSPLRPRFDLGSVRVGFVVDRVALGQVFFFSSTSVFPCPFRSTGAHLQGNTKKKIIFITGCTISLKAAVRP